MTNRLKSFWKWWIAARTVLVHHNNHKDANRGADRYIYIYIYLPWFTPATGWCQGMLGVYIRYKYRYILLHIYIYVYDLYILHYIHGASFDPRATKVIRGAVDTIIIHVLWWNIKTIWNRHSVTQWWIGGPTAPLNGNWKSFTHKEVAKLASQPAPFPIAYHSAPITAWSAAGWWRPIRYLVLKVITHRSGLNFRSNRVASNSFKHPTRPYLQPGKPISEARSLVDFFIKGFCLGSPGTFSSSRKPHKKMFHANTLWWTNIAMENHHFSWENPL